MKTVLLFAVGALSVYCANGVPASTYTAKYDGVNVDEILNNERLYKKYYDCLTNKGTCTADGKQLKDIIPDALKTGCSKCNPTQKQNTEKVIKYMIQKRPQDFGVLEKLYDPQGVYKKKFSKQAEQLGIKVH